MEEGSFVSDGVNSSGVISIKPNSYKSFYNLQQTGLSDNDMIPLNSEFEIPSLRYIKDKNGELYNLIGATNNPYYKLVINLDAGKINEFEGYAKTGKIITSSGIVPNPRGFVKLTVKDVPSQNDRIFIGDKTEIEISKYNLGDYAILASNSSLAFLALASSLEI